MNIQSLTLFFMWCSIINGGLLLVSWAFFKLAPDLIYRIQSWWFPLPRETLNVIFYSFLVVLELILFVFNLVPYLALLIIGS